MPDQLKSSSLIFSNCQVVLCIVLPFRLFSQSRTKESSERGREKTRSTTTGYPISENERPYAYSTVVYSLIWHIWKGTWRWLGYVFWGVAVLNSVYNFACLCSKQVHSQAVFFTLSVRDQKPQPVHKSATCKSQVQTTSRVSLVISYTCILTCYTRVNSRSVKNTFI